MKLTMKKSVAAKNAVPVTKTQKHTGPVISRGNYDNKVQFVGCRIPTSALMKKALGLSIAGLKETGYLLVHGDKPGIVIRAVKWDGKDVYHRTDAKTGELFGSLKALNGSKNKAFYAEIIDRAELVNRLAKFNRVVECVRVSDESKHTVCLLNSSADTYTAAVEVVHGKLVPLVLEPVASYNSKDVQYHNFKDVKADVSRMLPKH